VVNDPPVWGDFLSILRFLDVLTPAKRNAEHQALPVNAHVFPLALAPVWWNGLLSGAFANRVEPATLNRRYAASV
jgi:hypothetical protein